MTVSLAALLRDDEIARMRRRARLGGGGNEQQMHRLRHGRARRNVNERAILEKRRVQCRERIVLPLRVAAPDASQ